MSLTIKKNYLINNDCYKSGRTITPNSMQLHTIGTGQNTGASLASYWNQPGIQACVQYCIDAETPGLVYQFLPDNRRPWADAGYGNNNSIAVELMESDYMKYTGGANYIITNEAKFKADVTRAYNTAVEFFAKKCKEYGWNPQEKMANGLHRVYSHDEGRKLGLSSSHVDPIHIWSRYGWTMDQFRADVAKAMKGEIVVKSTEEKWYRIRKSWADEKSQIGAYQNFDKAREDCQDGYSVFDWNGNVVYTKTDANSSAQPNVTVSTPPYRVRKSWVNAGSQIGSFDVLENAKKAANQKPGYAVYDSNGIEIYRSVMSDVQKKNFEILAQLPDYKGLPDSQADYIKKVAEICVKLYPYTKILPSVVISQAFLENGGGTASDALVLTKNNNLVGIKSSLLTETWSQYSVWDGRQILKNTPEVYNGVSVRINDYFRVYSNYAESLLDYEMFLTWAKSGTDYKYRAVVGMTDPREMITYIRNKGYATSLSYIESVMRIINQYNLTKYDAEAGAIKANTSTQPVQTSSTGYYRVATAYANGKYSNQKGAYSSKENALAACKKLGGSYKVFDYNGKQIYPEVSASPAKATTASSTASKDIYAVRKTFADTQTQLGLFSVFDNAKKIADENTGYSVWDTTTKKVVYTPTNSAQKTLIAYLREMDKTVKAEIKAGKAWSYKNKKTSSLAKTFEKAISSQNRKVNCSTGVYWGLIGSGVVDKNRDGIQWNGNNGFVWLNKNAQANAMKYFDLITVGNKTVKQCIADGTLQAGDVVSYVDLAHTNVYIGDGKSFDTGHKNCSGSGEGAKFTCFISSTGYQNYRVAQILRLKGNKQYRVQCGVYSVKKNAEEYAKRLKDKGFDVMIINNNSNYIVQVGLFNNIKNAEALWNKVVKAGFSCMINEI